MTDDSLALQDIKKPTEHDILCGKYRRCYNHSGNDTYRELVNMNKVRYYTKQSVLAMYFANLTLDLYF